VYAANATENSIAIVISNISKTPHSLCAGSALPEQRDQGEHCERIEEAAGEGEPEHIQPMRWRGWHREDASIRVERRRRRMRGGYVVVCLYTLTPDKYWITYSELTNSLTDSK
jgi:hypothetical protein